MYCLHNSNVLTLFTPIQWRGYFFVWSMRCLVSCVCIALTACSAFHDPHHLYARDRPPELPVALTAQVRVQVIDTMLDLLATHYVDARRMDALTLAEWRATLLAETVALEDEDFWHRLDKQLGLLADSHTRLMSPAQVRIRATLWSPGLGGELEISDKEGGSTELGLRITRVQAGSAASNRGVQVGWRLRRLNGEDFGTAWARALNAKRTESTERAAHERTLQRVWLTNGPPWSMVFVSPEGQTHTVDLAATAISAQAIRNADGILQVSLPLIEVAGFETIERALREPVSGLVLDLRGSRGGSGDVALRILGLFVKDAPLIARLQTRSGGAITQGMTTVVPVNLHAAAHSDAHTYFDGPITVLIDSGTASSAELLAAGLQMLKRARISGSTSCGCMNPSLGWFNLPAGAQLLITEARAPLADGYMVEGHGVRPDENPKMP